MDGVERSGEEDNDGVGLEKRRVEKGEVLTGQWILLGSSTVS